MSTGSLLVFRNDRLGARLISLVNAMRVGARFDLPVQVRWVEAIGDRVGSEFNDPTEIFDAAFVEKYFIDAEEWRRRRGAAQKVANYLSDPDKVNRDVRNGKDITFDMAFGITVFNDESYNEVAKECRRIFHEFPVAPKLKDTVNILHRALSGAIAYHIRRGDLISDIRARNRRWPHKYIPDAYYYSHMEESIESGKQIVMFSDNFENLERFYTRFPALKSIGDLVDLDIFPRGARDFIEVYAMSCCDHIVAPSASAFSTTAANLGNVIKVDVKAGLSPAGLRKASEFMYKTFISEPDQLGDEGEVGQIIPHIAQYLEDNGRNEELVDLYERVTLKDRLSVSFLYPEAMQIFVRTGRLDLARKLSDRETLRYIYHERDVIRFEFARTAALSASGNHSKSLTSLRNIMALNSNAPELRQVLPSLYFGGVLDETNFFPITIPAMSLGGRALKLAKFNDLEGVILRSFLGRNTEISETRAIFETLILDWDFYFRKTLVSEFINSNIGKALAEHLSNYIGHGSSDPEFRSLYALMLAQGGKIGRTPEILRGCAEEARNNALIWKRLAQVHMLTREWSAAIEAAQSMLACSDSPAYAAFAAQLFQHNKLLKNEADTLINNVLKVGWNFVPFYGIAAKIRNSNGDKQGALEALATANDIMPLHTAYTAEYARQCFHVGDSETGRGILADLFILEKLPKWGYAALIEACLASGDASGAQDVLEKAEQILCDDTEQLQKIHRLLGKNLTVRTH